MLELIISSMVKLIIIVHIVIYTYLVHIIQYNEYTRYTACSIHVHLLQCVLILTILFYS